MKTLTSTNPATLAELGSVRTADPSEVVAAVEGARRAQREWGRMPLAARARLLRAASQVVARRSDDLARALTLESGKPLFESYVAEVLPTAETLRWLARFGPPALRPKRLRHATPLFRAKKSEIVYEPMGVVGIISPWNYPLAIPATETAFALMAGNAVVLKPSEHTPLIADAFRAILVEAGLDPELVHVVHGFGEVGAALVEARPDRILFTGSVGTGRKVAGAAGALGIPVTLELGGKDAMYVRADADLDRAVGGALFGGFFNAGQTCAAVERVYVHRDVFQEFLDRLVERAKGLRVGDPLSHATDVGPMIHATQRDVVAGQVAEAQDAGARVLAGGAVEAALPGAFYAPAVVADAPDDCRLMREETFGPVVPVRAVDSDEEAVALTNDSPYGLTASVWTRDVERARELAGTLEAGTVFVNDVLYSYASPDAPWGGVKSSGTGRTHSVHGLHELVNIKHVSVEPSFAPQIGYPYTKAHTQLVRGAIGAIYGRGARRLFAVGRASLAGVRVMRAARRRR